ncbi:YrzA family protein [Heyndrickxia coagulans]|uniref:YrzA family protein n=1 Tax=Heyndrickxia coagulans TaxID=1398 RepID=UPI002E1D1F8B|nr:YrzA family protein [Heyndrickxia coagulans]
MAFELDRIEDKIEFFEADQLEALVKKINDQIEANKTLLLRVASVSHQTQFAADGRPHYSAVVHFAAQK